MKYQQWSIPDLPAQAVDRLTGAGYPYLVSSVLASRGVTTPEEAAAFLERDRELPYSPFLMKDMDRAAPPHRGWVRPGKGRHPVPA